ncbi:MAG: efflux RND transporter permease subunit [Rhabdochlamydiaceae bacterium]|nr:efflux RND transporter permease subunit [Candidatus Amphrikana amoebophyrae]
MPNNSNKEPDSYQTHLSLINRAIYYCLKQRLLVFLGVFFLIIWGIAVAPFDWKIGSTIRNPVGVDAIPDISDNLQVVFTEWTGRSPQDVEDQITYPLTTALLGVPGVKNVRSYSFFGFSTINIIFEDKIDFYWSRSRILEKLNSLPSGTLPDDVQPALGPDATALGQIFWYTLEGKDEKGNVTAGWDLEELRTIQDWHVRYALLSAGGVSDVASIGGYVKAYQIDVNPDSLRAYKIGLSDVFKAVKMSNLDVGARTIEVNQVEYFIRGIGFIKSLSDIENSVITARDNLPVTIKDVADVSYGPFIRRGALNKEGSEAVGGIVIARFGVNTLEVIDNIKERIEEVSMGLPSKILPDGTISKVSITPYYDRTDLIHETLGTLNKALIEEVLIAVIVILIVLMNLRSSILIASLIPLSVLITFIIMKLFNIDANIVSLSGIAIAIGTIAAMGVFICENILSFLTTRDQKTHSLSKIIYKATAEVGSAVLTAAATTIVSFLPVFTMIGPEGRLFKPLAFTKTFVIVASIISALFILPAFARILFINKDRYLQWPKIVRIGLSALLLLLGIYIAITIKWWIGLSFFLLGIYACMSKSIPDKYRALFGKAANIFVIILLAFILTNHWLPLGPEKGVIKNLLFVGVTLAGFLIFFRLFQRFYSVLLRFCLSYKTIPLFCSLVIAVVGAFAWIGVPKLTSGFPTWVKNSSPVTMLSNTFPGLGKEFMPPLDEGSFLYMPITMSHAGTGEVEEILKFQSTALNSIPEVNNVVGKWGRAETALDPAPITMFETVINYYPKYLENSSSTQLRFKYNGGKIDYFRNIKGDPVLAPDGKPYFVRGLFERDNKGQLIPDKNGIPFRMWRPKLTSELNPGRSWKGINSINDIWIEIEAAAQMTGVTSSPKLQPIAARIVMLQSGMRAPMGIKIKGPDLATIEKFGLELEKYLKEIPSIYEPAVIADRIIGKPYQEIEFDREKLARFGLRINEVQNTVQIALGGMKTTTTVEGRERFPVRVRYLRELRDNVAAMENLLFTAESGEQIPLSQIANIKYVRGPQVIKSEDTFLVGYVLFDMKEGFAEVNVVEEAQSYLNQKIENNELIVPNGVSFAFSGSYENQIRAQKKLSIILPIALFIIMLILYFQFKSFATAFVVFSGILIAWAGGFLLLWLYGESWFLNGDFFGVSLKELFQIHPINLSVAVWVGFLALFGIASDNGVIIASSIAQTMESEKTDSIQGVRNAVHKGAIKRVRPVVITSAITILALLPILSSSGRGSDIMIPVAIPSFGGMIIALLSIILVPVLYCAIQEIKLKIKK